MLLGALTIVGCDSDPAAESDANDDTVEDLANEIVDAPDTSLAADTETVLDLVVDTGPADLTPPMIASVTPTNGTTGVPPWAEIRVVFSEVMDPSVSGIEVSSSVGPNVQRTAHWEAGDTELVINAVGDWTPGATIGLTISGDHKDRAGNLLGTSFASSFVVGSDDVVAVVASEPSEGATVSPDDLTLVLEFSVEMNSFGGTLELTGGPGVIESTELDGRTLLAELSGLAPATNYRVSLQNYLSADGRELDPTAYLNDGVLDFATSGDSRGPSVTGTAPSDGSFNVEVLVSTRIFATFDEDMDTAVVTAPLVADTQSVTVDVSWLDPRTAAFEVGHLLVGDAFHALDLRGLRDTSGNLLRPEPVLSDGILSFFAGGDSIAPTLTASTPAEGAVDVSTAIGEAGLEFDEPMDLGVTTVPWSSPSDQGLAALTYGLGGLSATVDLSGILAGDDDYRLDLSGLQDLAGNPLAPIPLLLDGALDFSTGPASGESCADPVTIDTAAFDGSRYHWSFPPEAVLNNDSATGFTCDASHGPDLVIRYEKTSDAPSAGGNYLSVSATTAAANDELDVMIVGGDCDPSSGTVEVCRNGLDDLDLFADLPAGTYWIWIAVDTTFSGFEGTEVTIEELPVPPEGEHCANPYDTSSNAYLSPQSSGDPHRWIIPGDLAGVDAQGQFTCDTSTAADAVVRYDKMSETSLLRIQVIAPTTTSSLTVQVQDACDVTTGVTTCDNGDDEYTLIVGGPAGPRWIWVAAGVATHDFGGAVVSVEEIQLSAGESCESAHTASAGSIPIVGSSATNLQAASCMTGSDPVEWYRVSTGPAAQIVSVIADQPGTVAIVDPDTGAELGCSGESNIRPLARLIPAGSDVCVGVVLNQGVGSLLVQDQLYDGVSTPVDIGATASSSWSLDSWMAVSSQAVYLSNGSSWIDEIPKAGGTAINHGPSEGLGSANLGYAGAVFGDALFSLDQGSVTTNNRLFQVYDGTTWAVNGWDPMPSYPARPFYAIGPLADTGLIAATLDTANDPTELYSFDPTQPSAGVLLGTNNHIEVVAGIAADDVYIYLAGRVAGLEGIYRLARADVGSPDVIPERLTNTVNLSGLRAPLVIDDLNAPSHLYFRIYAPAGIGVIVDPAGAAPLDLGHLVEIGSSSDYGMTFDHTAGSLYFFESSMSQNGTIQRMDP